MTLRVPEDIDALRRQRDAMLRLSEGSVEEVVGRAIKRFLKQAKSAARKSLTAAGPSMPRMASEVFTLGQMNAWWTEAVNEEVNQEVMSVWNRGRSEATDLAATQRSLDSAGEYLAQVSDRLTNRDGSLPQAAFDKVRVALADEVARGSSNSVISQRIASELNWTGPDRGLWESRLAEANKSIDDILDPLGPPGSAAREAARLNDPQVRALQQARTQAVKALDADASTWQSRASLIARTETTAAYNAGALSAFHDEQAGVKAWISTLDDRTRETHLTAYGQCVPLGQAFRIGQHMMEMPGDPKAPASETANCRCTMIAGRDCNEVGGWSAGGVQARPESAPSAVEVDGESSSFSLSTEDGGPEASLPTDVGRTIDRLNASWGKTVDRVVVADYTGYASAGGSPGSVQIAVNRSTFLDDAFVAAREKDMKDFVVGTSRSDTIVHEFGHALERRLTPAQLEAVRNDFVPVAIRQGGVIDNAVTDIMPSVYALESMFEWSAELFALGVAAEAGQVPAGVSAKAIAHALDYLKRLRLELGS